METGVLARFRINGQLAVVVVNDAMTDRQAQAGAVGPVFGGEERGEDAIADFLGNSAAVDLDGGTQPAPAFLLDEPCGDCDDLVRVILRIARVCGFFRHQL